MKGWGMPFEMSLAELGLVHSFAGGKVRLCNGKKKSSFLKKLLLFSAKQILF